MALSINFAAFDFETADRGRDSACSIGLVVVKSGKIVRKEYRLIRPPRPLFEFSWLHGITWEHVAREPDFGCVWRDLQPLLEDIDYLAAHHAPFDRGVLEACCHAHKILPPILPYICTVRLARKVWQLRPAKLANVCEHLGIELQHHHALSDAEACARIVMAAITHESPNHSCVSLNHHKCEPTRSG